MELVFIMLEIFNPSIRCLIILEMFDFDMLNLLIFDEEYTLHLRMKANILEMLILLRGINITFKQ